MSEEPPAARHEIFVEWTIVVKKVRDKRRFLDWHPMQPSYGKYNEQKTQLVCMISLFFLLAVQNLICRTNRTCFSVCFLSH